MIEQSPMQRERTACKLREAPDLPAAMAKRGE